MTTQELQVLKENGFRLTPQRRAVLDVLAKQGGDLTAEAIYEEARQQYPQLSLPTVYRTLAVLKESHLVEQHYVSADHERSHFALIGASERAHFHCLGCGQIIEFHSAEIVEAVRHELGDSVLVTQVCMCVEGYCSRCQP